MSKFKRTGKCTPSACGSFCCKAGPVLLNVEGDNREDLLRHAGMFGWKVERDEETGLTAIHSGQSCKYLSDRGLCKIHGRKPKRCKEFPNDPKDPLFITAKKHGCTYDFVEE